MVRLLRPYEILLMLLSVLWGLGYLFSPPPSTVEAVWPPWATTIWALALFGTGVLGLSTCAVGSMMEAELMHLSLEPDQWRAKVSRFQRVLILERGALIGQGGALFVIFFATGYAWATGKLASAPLIGLGFALAWTAANTWRSIQIHFVIKEADDLLAPPPET